MLHLQARAKKKHAEKAQVKNLMQRLSYPISSLSGGILSLLKIILVKVFCIFFNSILYPTLNRENVHLSELISLF